MKRNTRHPYYPARLVAPAALCVAGILAALCARVPVHAQQRRAARPAARTAWTTLFQVSAELDGAQIEPILRYAGGRFEQVPDSGKGPFNKQLAGTLYKAGRQHTVIFGGGRVGTATVKSPLPDSECSQTVANVTFDAPIKLGGNVFALATDSQTLGRPAPSRRAPTPEERAAVGRLVESLYKQHGVPAARASAFDTINLTATDLDGDGTVELIGTFKLKRTPDISDMLFLLAELQGTDYRAGVANYEKVEKATLDDINEDAFAGVGPAGFLFEVLLDQVDTDGDGTGEVVTRNLSFEGIHFNLYQRRQGRWQKAGEFYNYHCAY